MSCLAGSLTQRLHPSITVAVAGHMESAFLQAPFVITDTRKLRNAPNKAEILGQKVLSDCLGQGTMGELYLNQQCPSVGLVCGTSVSSVADMASESIVPSLLALSHTNAWR